MYTNGRSLQISHMPSILTHEQVPFWITATVVDIVIDVTLIILSAHLVWRLRLDYRQKTIATSIFSLRILYDYPSIHIQHCS
jgi:hypothetical protein